MRSAIAALAHAGNTSSRASNGKGRAARAQVSCARARVSVPDCTQTADRGPPPPPRCALRFPTHASSSGGGALSDHVTLARPTPCMARRTSQSRARGRIEAAACTDVRPHSRTRPPTENPGTHKSEISHCGQTRAEIPAPEHVTLLCWELRPLAWPLGFLWGSERGWGRPGCSPHEWLMWPGGGPRWRRRLAERLRRGLHTTYSVKWVQNLPCEATREAFGSQTRTGKQRHSVGFTGRRGLGDRNTLGADKHTTCSAGGRAGRAWAARGSCYAARAAPSSGAYASKSRRRRCRAAGSVGGHQNEVKCDPSPPNCSAPVRLCLKPLRPLPTSTALLASALLFRCPPRVSCSTCPTYPTCPSACTGACACCGRPRTLGAFSCRVTRPILVRRTMDGGRNGQREV